MSQKIHMTNEDLYIAIAGFRTSKLGFAAYLFICLSTFGLGWLLFRWMPEWHVKLTGRQVPLHDCQWVVLENQWNEMSIITVDSKPYGRVLSTVFGAPGKMNPHFGDDDPDPILRDLRTLNYRYVRLYFHPLKDKFQQCTGWKDPMWSDVRTIRAGIDQEEKSHRDVVFGPNLVDIEQKSIFRLLVDEVSSSLMVMRNCGYKLTLSGIPPILRLSDRQSDPVVSGRVLLLRGCYLSHVVW